VSEREQTEPDGIDFDFFDDAPTAGGDSRKGEPRRRPRMPGGPSGPNAPLLRLAALIAGGILLAVVLVLWVNACRADAKKAQYEDYMAAVDKIGGDSAQVGKDLNELIFSSGIQLEELQTQLDGLRDQQSQTVARAEALDAPGPLRKQQESLVEALQFRVSGLNGLARAFSQITGAEASEDTGNMLAQQSYRLIASDVLWEDLFKARAQEVMDKQGVTGVAVPDSRFVGNTEFGSPTSWKLVVERLTSPTTGGAGLHGNRIAGVRVQPGGEQLSPPPAENTVHASDDLVIEVLVENSGDNQETQVKVTLTIQQQPESIKGEQTIQAINPKDTKTVKFKISSLGTLALATRTIVKVTVEPVPGESNTNNNTAEYTVFFSLEE
jgi:hypothetical protein